MRFRGINNRLQSLCMWFNSETNESEDIGSFIPMVDNLWHHQRNMLIDSIKD